VIPGSWIARDFKSRDRVNRSWILELNFRNLDMTSKVTGNHSVRNHEVSIVSVVLGTKILEKKML
jgi:hypothetical protein